MRRSAFSVIVLIAVAHLAGTAQAAPHVATKGDPWERVNRRGYAINQVLDRIVVRPLALFARALTPGPLGRAVHHALVNLSEPVVIINDMLQLRVKKAANSTARLALNSSVGLGGMIDVAAKAGLPHHDNGFSDTLGRYGVHTGAYVYLPLLGPSTVRDLFGSAIDSVSNPLFFIQYPNSNNATLGVGLLTGLDARAEADPDLQVLLQDATDPYATLRSTYLQSRQGEINEDKPLPALPDFGDAPGEAAASITPSTPAAAEKTPAFEPLPEDKGGNADHQVPGPLDQGNRQSQVGTQPK